jgi:hypothetical protein
MLSYPSISLIESISPFRLIEHQIHPIVNSVEGFHRAGQELAGPATQLKREASDAK